MECSHSQRQMSHTESPPGGTGEGGVIKLLERTEAELFEVKAELKIKVCVFLVLFGMSTVRAVCPGTTACMVCWNSAVHSSLLCMVIKVLYECMCSERVLVLVSIGE